MTAINWDELGTIQRYPKISHNCMQINDPNENDPGLLEKENMHQIHRAT